MYAITIVLLATYAAAGKNTHIQQKGKNTGLRVLGGVDDTTGKYPYVVALKGTYPALDKICTGSLIKDSWVLTAAHCLKPFVKYIQFGNMSIPLAATKTKSTILKMISHPAYLGSKIQSNDIGLAMVERVVGMTKYARISAVDYRTLLGQPVAFAGFGMTFLPIRDSHNKLQEYVLDLFRPLQIGEGVVTVCGDSFRANQICARAKCTHHKQMVLHGDSGGPLLFEKKIVGVAHAVIYNTFEQSFTPVSPFVSWIYLVVTSDGKSPIPQKPHEPQAAPGKRSARIVHTSF